MKPRLFSLFFVLFIPLPLYAQTATFTLMQLLDRAFLESPLLSASRRDELAAGAGITTARAYPNPEFEIGGGQASSRVAGGVSGFAPMLGIAQVIESPSLRAARLRSAQDRLQIAEAQTGATRTFLAAEIKRRYYEVVRLQEEQKALNEDLLLTEQIRERVRVRVRSGEAARFDQVRADNEVAIVRKNLDGTTLRIGQALSQLRQAVSPSLPPQFEISVATPEGKELLQQDYQRLRDLLLQNNPEIAVAKRELQRAEQQIAVERALVLPQFTLRATQDRDPSVTINRIGAQVQIPLLNRREGPIAEAQAQAQRYRDLLGQRELDADAGFEAAWQSYRAALTQLSALEGGIIERARAVVDIAEAAYRFGERGILEFLDAQRQFRLSRNELLQARHATRIARLEIERLAGQP